MKIIITCQIASGIYYFKLLVGINSLCLYFVRYSMYLLCSMPQQTVHK